MSEPLIFDGKEYISASRAAKEIGYSADYIGQLSRGRKISAKLIGKTWYVDFDSLTNYKNSRKGFSKEKESLTRVDEIVPKFNDKYLFNYENDERSRLPELNKKAFLNKPVTVVSSGNSRRVGKLAVLTVAVLISLGSGFYTVGSTYPEFVANAKTELASISTFGEKLIEEISLRSGLALAVVPDSVNSFFDNVGEGFDYFKKIIFGKIFFVSNPPAKVATSEDVTPTVVTESEPTVPTEPIIEKKIEKPKPAIVAVTNVSQPLNLGSIKNELKTELENFVRTQIRNINSPTIIYSSAHATSNANLESFKQNQVIPITYRVVTTQSDRDAGSVSSAISALTSDGSFTRARFETICISSDCRTSWPSGGGGTASFFGDLEDVATSSDATGDVYYLNSLGQITNLGAGTDGQVLKLSSGLPTWDTDNGGSGVFPFTPTSYGVSTSTTVAFLNGLLSTASSTFNSALRLPTLSSGGLGVGTGGLVYSGATTTAGTGLTYSSNSFNVDASQNITALSNLTSNGFVRTSGGNGTLSIDTTTYLSSYDAWTHPVAGKSATTSEIRISGGLLSNASTTIDSNLLVTGNSTTTNATTTNFYTTTASTTNFAVGGGTLSLFGVSGTSLSAFCTSITGSSDLCDGSDATGAGGTFPFTPTAYGVSTSTTIGLLNGFLSTASSTIDSNLLVTGSTTLQNFTFNRATGTSATTTNFFATTASTTNLAVGGGTLSIFGTSGTTLAAFCTAITGAAGLCDGSDDGSGGATFGKTFELFTPGRLSATSSIALYVGATTTASISNNSYFQVNATSTTGDLIVASSTASFAGNFLRFLNSSGSELFRLDSTGGLQTTASTTLQNFTAVNSTSTSATTTNSFSTTASSTNLFSSLINIGSNSLVVDSSGSVGVGTGAPTRPFHVANSSGGISALFAGRVDSTGSFNTTSEGGGFQWGNWSAQITSSNAARSITIAGNPTDGATAVSVITDAVSSLSNASARLLSVRNAGVTKFDILASGNVGVGSTTPYARLSVTGGTSGTIIAVDAATGFSGNLLDLKVASTTKFIVNQNGDFIASGNSTTTSATTTNFYSTTASTTNFAIGGGTLSIFGTSGTTLASFCTAITGGAGLCDGDDATSAGAAAVESKWATTSGAYLGITPNGGTNVNLGIGTTTPVYTLTVASTSGPQLSLSSGAGFAQWTMRNAGGNLYFATTTTAGTATTSTSALSIIGSTGLVGIGTTSPLALLSVNPLAGTHGFTVGSSTATYFMVDKSGNVGVGTAAPTSKLEVDISVNGVANANETALTLRNQGDSGDNVYMDFFSGSSANQAIRFGVATGGDSSVINFNATDGLDFQTSDGSGVMNSRLTIKTGTPFGAQVGIGTTTPFYALTIASSSQPQLSLSAGAGFAQWTFRNAGGKLYLATTTVAGTATSTVSALSIDQNGLVTFGLNAATCAALTGSSALCDGDDATGAAGFGKSWEINPTGYLAPTSTQSVIIGATSSPRHATFQVTATSTQTTGDLINASSTASFAGNFLRFLNSSGTELFRIDSTGGLQTTASTTLQNFTAINSTSTSATTTNSFSNNLTVADGNILQKNSTFTAGGAHGTSTAVFPPFVFAQGKFAYVGSGTNAGTCDATTATGCEFRIYDIHNPSVPDYLGGINLGTYGITAAVQGKYAYIGDANGMHVYDISVPSAPTSVADISASISQGLQQQGVFISGKYLYFVTDNDTGTCDVSTATGCEFRIYDISNPALPVFVSGYNFGVNAHTVYVSGKYAYVGTARSGGSCTIATGASCSFKIFNISNPASISVVSGLQSDLNVSSVYVSGEYLFLSLWESGTNMFMYDISAPSSPALVSSFSVSTSIYSLAVAGKYLYLASGADSGTCSGTVATGCEFRIYDIASSTAPSFVGGFNMAVDTTSIRVQGKYAYLTPGPANANQWSILDISGIDSPAANIGTIASNYLSVSEDARVENNFYVGTSLNVGGGGINSNGPLAVMGNPAGQAATFQGGNVLVGTSTPQQWLLTLASSTVPQLSLSSGAGIAQWTMRNAGGNLYFATTTTAGTATTSLTALTILGSSGRVGIGIDIPTEKLHVAGNLLVTGNSTTTSATTTNFYSTTASTTNFSIGGGTLSIFGTSGTTLASFCTAITGGAGLCDGDDASGGASTHDEWTHPSFGLSATTSQMLIGTTTASNYALTVSSSTAPQLSLSSGAGFAQWTMRNAGGDFFLATTTTAGTATTSTSALSIIGSTGRVGIGTSTPAGLLSINPLAGTAPEFIIGSTTATHFIVDKSGKVGIGITNPTYLLEVAETGGANFSLTRNDSAITNQETVATIHFRGTDANATQDGADITAMSVGTWNGVGTAPTQLQFHFVEGAAAFMQAQGTAIRLGLGDESPNINGLDLLSDTTGDVGIIITQTNGSDLDPIIRFELAEETGLFTMGVDDSDSDKFKISAGSITLGTNDRFVIDGSGNIGIATSTPWRTLSVNGTAAFTSLTNNSTGYYACISTPGGELATSTSACGASSIRYKENVTDSSYGLAEVMQLRSVLFDWKKSFIPDGTRQLGFIAEEVESLIPELITYNADGQVMNLDYPKLTSVLTKAIQELNTKVDNLSATSSAVLINNEGFDVTSIFDPLIAKLSDWGLVISQTFTRITNLFVGTIHVEDKLCVDDVCVGKEQLKALLIQAGGTSQTPAPAPIVETPSPTASTTDPVIDEEEPATESATTTEELAEETVEEPPTSEPVTPEPATPEPATPEPVNP